MIQVENLFLLGGAAIAAGFFSGAFSYRGWKRRELADITSGGILCETRLGPVEYQVAGDGPAVLYAHGTPGGYEQGTSFAHFIGIDRCKFISPSRPGYLRTPLSSGASPEEQADLYAALLDELGIEQASIIGFSGGGPAALQFALRHPERCRSLIMMGAIAQRHDFQQYHRALPFLKRWFVQLSEHLLISERFIFLALPLAKRIAYGKAVAGMLCSGAAFHLRREGYENDFAQFAALDDYPLEQITIPTLVVHGTLDEDVPFADAQLLLQHIPDVTMMALAKGDHTAFYMHAKTVMPAVRDFIINKRRTDTRYERIVTTPQPQCVRIQ